MRIAILLAVAPLVACAPANRIGLHTTEAATSLAQITRGVADERGPAIARDGATLAYESSSPGQPPRVEVVPLDGRSTPRAVVDQSSEPAWFPGTGGLVCVSHAAKHDDKTQLVQTFGPLASAFSAPLGHALLGAGWPAVSPDGRWVAASLGNAHVFFTHTRASSRFDPALVLVEARGTGTVALGSGAEPSWSPDGTRLAFVRKVGDRAHVFVAEAKRGAKAIAITDGADDDALPAWSPDGALVAFCSSPVSDGIARNANLFVVRPDGSGLRQVTEGDANACRPAWAPDGTLYFHANADGRFHIWRLRLR